MHEIEIRRLVASEISEAVGLLAVLNPDVVMDELANRLRQMLVEYGNYQIVGAFVNGQLAGVCGAWWLVKVWCGRHLEIDNLVVAPAFRGAGIGARLIEHFMAEAKAQGGAVLTLDSYAKNQESHRLYQRLGFEPWSIHFVNPIGNWTGGGGA